MIHSFTDEQSQAAIGAAIDTTVSDGGTYPSHGLNLAYQELTNKGRAGADAMVIAPSRSFATIRMQWQVVPRFE